MFKLRCNPTLGRALTGASLLLLSACGSPEQRAQSYYQEGMQYIAKHDDLNARVALHSSIKFKSDRADVWRALIGVEERLKDGSAVFQDLRRLVELDPKDLEARVKLARILVAGGAIDPAQKLIDIANDHDKPYAPLHALKASIFARTGDSAGALREAQRALQIDPNNVDATMLVAAQKATQGDTDGALKQLDALKPSAPDDELSLSLEKVRILVRKGDAAQAQTLLKQLVAQNPKDARLRAQLVQLYISSKRFDDAERELRAEADADPKDTKLGMNLVRFLIATKGAKAGRDELNARIKAGGDVFDYRIALAELDFADNNVPAATQALQGLASSAATPEQKLEAQSKLAEMYVNKGNFAAADPVIADILQKDAHNTVALRLRATGKIEKGQLESAIIDLRQALNNQPKSVDLLLLMGLAYERGGKIELADRQYADALRASSLNPNVAQRYVAFLEQRGEWGHAEDVIGDVIAKNPPNVGLLTTLAQIRLARHNWVGALSAADDLAHISKDNSVPDQIRATALAGQNKPDQSIAALEKAHADAPDAYRPVVSLVSAYIRVGKPEKAEALLQSIQQKYPDNAEILILMGQTKLAQKKYDDAQKDYREAIAKQPKDPNGYSALSDLFVRQKDYDLAAQIIQTGLREQPGNLGLRLMSAGLQIEKGDDAGAIAQYEAILKDQPQSLLAINNLASLLLDHRSDKASLDQALSLVERLKISPLPQFEDTYGWAQLKKGNAKEAVTVLESAAQKMPNLAAIHYHLGMAYRAAGQADKASEQFKRAMELEPDGTPLKASISAAIH